MPAAAIRPPVLGRIWRRKENNIRWRWRSRIRKGDSANMGPIGRYPAQPPRAPAVVRRAWHWRDTADAAAWLKRARSLRNITKRERSSPANRGHWPGATAKTTTPLAQRRSKGNSGASKEPYPAFCRHHRWRGPKDSPFLEERERVQSAHTGDRQRNRAPGSHSNRRDRCAKRKAHRSRPEQPRDNTCKSRPRPIWEDSIVATVLLGGTANHRVPAGLNLWT